MKLLVLGCQLTIIIALDILYASVRYRERDVNFQSTLGDINYQILNYLLLVSYADIENG